MPEQIDIQELLKKNNIDPNCLEKSREIRAALQKSGMRGAGYNLSSPVDRRKASVCDDAADPRTIHLRKNGG